MDEKNNGGSAFPDFKQTGITARDYLAAKAMQALMSKALVGTEPWGPMVASTAYKVADLMLAERAK
jgi:hypothetical protein